MILFTRTAFAQTNVASDDEIPSLIPPRVEIPPTFWEQHGTLVIVVGILIFAAAALVLWLLVRPKPPIIVPPGVQAREALKPLENQPENGALLSRVSQVVRHYFAGAFGLPPGELNTTEFSRALNDLGRIGPDLAGAVIDFLRQCDQRKFAPDPPSPPLGAVTQAARFIDLAEARRAAAQERSQT